MNQPPIDELAAARFHNLAKQAGLDQPPNITEVFAAAAQVALALEDGQVIVIMAEPETGRIEMFSNILNGVYQVGLLETAKQIVC